MKADHQPLGVLTAAMRCYTGRAFALTLLVALAMLLLPALHHHVDRGLFSDDCPLARLACGVAGTLPKEPELSLRLPSPSGVVSSTAPVLIRSQLLSSFGSRAPPTAT